MRKTGCLSILFYFILNQFLAFGQSKSTLTFKKESEFVLESRLLGQATLYEFGVGKGYFPKYSKLSEISGIVFSTQVNQLKSSLKDVTIEIRSNDSILIEKCITDSNGYFQFKKLDYEKLYTAYFSKPGYYSRYTRVYTFNVPDSLKEKKFGSEFGGWLINFQITLTKIVDLNAVNPFDRDFAVLMYKPIEIKTDELVKSDASTNFLLIKSGGIIPDENYSKSNDEWERRIEKDLFAELDKKSQKQIEEFSIKLKVKQLEKEKILQEKLLLAQTNKLNQSELAKEKAIASSKENEVKILQQTQKLNSLEEEQKEIEHKAQLKQRLLVIYAVALGLCALLIFTGFIFRSLRQRNRQNKIIIEQKSVVEEKNKEILDSIEYAKRIQATILPSVRLVKKYLEESFILYLPKDIVAGDFYWMESIADEPTVYFAACDCTGHGVPGAMVSVVCHNALNKSLKEFGKRTPAEILDKVAEMVIEDFNKNAEDNDEVKDGMDASLCALNVETGQLQWAGANNALWIIKSDGILNEYKPDKQPVGKSYDRIPFTNNQIQLEKGDTLFLFTDGYADQFGGTNSRKFQRKAFKELLVSIHQQSMEQQRETIYNTFENWRGANEQVDDVCVIGVRV